MSIHFFSSFFASIGGCGGLPAVVSSHLASILVFIVLPGHVQHRGSGLVPGHGTVVDNHGVASVVVEVVIQFTHQRSSLLDAISHDLNLPPGEMHMP